MIKLIRCCIMGFFVTSILVAHSTFGQTFQLLHYFVASEGSSPHSKLVQGNDDFLYGTTFTGSSPSRAGSIFKISYDGVLTTLVCFDTNNGANPQVGLVLGTDGNFYGSTLHSAEPGGGTNKGMLFRVTSHGNFAKLATFNGTNGAAPWAELVEGENGNFYGTTRLGGDFDRGTIFRINTNGTLAKLFSFDGTNGAGPVAALIWGADGNLYGNTQKGPLNQGFLDFMGTVFKTTINGDLTTLVNFRTNNGAYPSASLVQNGDGTFYGTTEQGRQDLVYGPGKGTVFQMNSTGNLTQLAVFEDTNGSYPQSSLVKGPDGCFYGTTRLGGQFFAGTIFRITTDGVLTTIHHFNGTNGAAPMAGLTMGHDGNLYGMTSAGSIFGGTTTILGVVYRLVMTPALTLVENGNELALSWPTNISGFTLQSATDLNSPINWFDSTNAPAVVGGQFMVTNTFSVSGQFFRLKK